MDYSIDELKKWQDSVVVMAKKILRENGELRPVAFFLTERMNIDQDLQEAAIMLNTSDKELSNLANAENIKPADTVVLVIDLVLTPAQALAVIKSQMPPEQSAIINLLEVQGRTIFGVQDPSIGMAKVLMNRLNLDVKDVVAMAIQLVIKKTDAVAYIKVDETWMVEAKDKTGDDILKYNKEHGTLENHPEAKEAITTFLETNGFVRMVSSCFRRNRPKTGRVIGFDEPKEIIETDETRSEQKTEGRFAHLFDKAKARPKPPVSPSAN